MNFSKRIVRRVLFNIAKSKLHNLYNFDKFNYDLHNLLHNSQLTIVKLILHAIDKWPYADCCISDLLNKYQHSFTCVFSI